MRTKKSKDIITLEVEVSRSTNEALKTVRKKKGLGSVKRLVQQAIHREIREAD